ncbi:MAG: WG repeat-containing protein [Bryobacterales bacterium]|nr:WG repeat-containing protein [Bryobacterales bacterium]
MQDFSEGLAAVGVGGKRNASGEVTTMDGGKWGFIDATGKIIIPPQFDEVKPFSSGVAAVWSQQKKKFGLIDRTGALIVPYVFDAIEPFYEGLAVVRGPDGSGYITPDGRLAIRTTEFDGSSMFSEGLAVVQQGKAVAGFIDMTGRFRIPMRFAQAREFSEGLAAVESDGNWGYIDKTGAMVIQPRFTSATAFTDGLALVETGAFWSYIDTNGAIILDDVFRSR